ncbi:MAG: peptidoglycan-binding protein [Coriobacteriales bacterium]|jgi:peptidoglycan hydrolase-like protein with peptidoglycan-binding domain|nr:peptidoglycan-binding protein [Coriobacteriales bacterium]
MTNNADITLVPGSSGPAVWDVQARLQTFGLDQAVGLVADLGDEAKTGVFGPRTAQAVAAFRQTMGLPAGDEVDRDTWTALVDATFTFGDRLLYLRLPHFHGCDVHTLQTALSSLGFSCVPDGIFGGHTEHAVREFQQNAGIDSDGIVGDSTFSAILRLRHAWEGKDPLSTGARALGFARAAEVLERTPICIYGTDECGRAVAERISNLAMATTAASLVVSASTLEQAPDDSMLMVQLITPPCEAAAGAGEAAGATQAAMATSDVTQATGMASASLSRSSRSSRVRTAQVPQVLYDSDHTLKARMATAISLITAEQPRVTVLLAFQPQEGQRLSPREEQHTAIVLLDALCSAYA